MTMRFAALSYRLNKLTDKLLPESLGLRLRFRWLHGAWPQNPPRTLADKMFFCLTHDRNDQRPLFADKLSVRDHVAARGYSGNLPHIYGVYDRVEDIDFSALPARYVIKATHGSGFVRLVTPESPVDIATLKKECAYWLAHDYYFFRREWYYRALPRRILIEEFIGDAAAPIDYKVFVANGRVLCVQVEEDRFGDWRRTFYNKAWQRLPFSHRRRTADNDLPRPRPLAAMLVAAVRLAEGVQFARVDFYVEGDKFYFGEITNCPGAGGAPINPPEWNEILGDAFGDVQAA